MSTDQLTQNRLEALYQIAEPQAGFFTSAQARGAGLTRRQMTYYAATRRFIRIKRGIYRLALFPNSRHEDLVIAWLEAGLTSVISHESALALYELSDILPAKIHLTIPRTASRRHAGLRLHTSRLEASEITHLEGLPVTTVVRTIGDVAAGGLPDELVLQAIGEALQRGLITKESLLALASQRGGRAARLVQSALEDKEQPQ